MAAAEFRDRGGRAVPREALLRAAAPAGRAFPHRALLLELRHGAPEAAALSELLAPALAAASPAELQIIAGEATRRKRFDVSAAAEERLRAVEPWPAGYLVEN